MLTNHIDQLDFNSSMGNTHSPNHKALDESKSTVLLNKMID